jgi:hypothetical protein
MAVKVGKISESTKLESGQKFRILPLALDSLHSAFCSLHSALAAVQRAPYCFS